MADRWSQLKTAYTQTRYSIEIGGGAPCNLQPGQKSPQLDEWMQKQGFKRLHVITAYNPTSRVCSAKQNQQAMLELKQELHRRQWPNWPARNETIAGDWPVEPSLAIGGQTAIVVLQLAEQFGQYAVLEHQRGLVSKLLYTSLFPCRET